MRTSDELREGFLSFFEERGHLRCPSAPLVPRADDRSTLLTTAGMQPQMPFFLGRETPPAPLTTTVQKSFRTQDIDEVGGDGSHLTFFEMLGNFSFGQYFKDGAIELAAEFVRERMRLDWDRIWVSVFAGDMELQLGPDEVAIELWERSGMPPDRIVPLPASENFWSVGGPGPCGPDSELYYDWGAEHGCGTPECLPGCDRCERFLEFWNLVFMEFELHPDGTLTPLPRQNIDTGLGLERGSAMLQGVRSVYETDGYQQIMGWIAAESGVAYGDSPQATKAHRVLADHGRGMTFLVADGVTPSNEGRGYVLRRIIRRAVQQAQRIGLENVYRLPSIVVDQMGAAYPELREHADEIQRVVRQEEERFAQTLSTGMRLLGDVLARSSEGVGGADAFLLHDTYGFPLELTRELALEHGLSVDEDEFERLMAGQRDRSRAARASELELAAELARAADFTTLFVGYERLDVRTQIGALESVGDGRFLAKLRESPFYPEGGGQVSDHGWIEKDDGSRAELVAAFRIGEDQALLLEGEGFAEGDRVHAVVPWAVRFPTTANHTATHLLHGALREVLGDHVRQAGSAVRPDKLRFDYSHSQPLSPEERRRIEAIVNERIFLNLPVRAFVTPIEEARKLGAMMLFGEKYGDVVRVIEVGHSGVPVSVELCGGTHVRSTAEIGPFKILTESSVGSATRRIEAVTAGAAASYLFEQEREAARLREELELERRAWSKLEKQLRSSGGQADDVAGRLLDAAREAGGVRVVVGEVGEMDADALLDLSDRIKQKAAPAAVVLGARSDGRVHLVANFSDAVAERVSASDVVRAAAAVVGGGGGGRPTMARAGGKEPEKLPEAIEVAERAIFERLS